MKNAFQKSPYATTAAGFLVMLAAGHIFWNWGAITTAFCLLLYCIVAVAIKLDEIAQRLDGLSEQLRRLSAIMAAAPTVTHEPSASKTATPVYPSDAGAFNGPDATNKP